MMDARSRGGGGLWWCNKSPHRPSLCLRTPCAHVVERHCCMLVQQGRAPSPTLAKSPAFISDMAPALDMARSSSVSMVGKGSLRCMPCV